MLIHFLQRSSEELLEGRIVQAAELLAKKNLFFYWRRNVQSPS